MKTIITCLLGGLIGFGGAASQAAAQSDSIRPNILWITSEDNGPHLGVYGDDYATSPNLDALAAKGMIYRYCWSTAPVCAPARTTIISGVYPPSTGSQHMRSLTRLPESMKMYPQYLQELGYYCTNNNKEDYNLEKVGPVWDDSSRQGHWKNRQEGQPFFAIFNHTVSHESQIRRRPHTPVHDPAKVRVPGYHPDTPEVRQDWAQYYDKIMEMDALAGNNLRELEEAGLAEDTIIFYYGDHGSGMPRNKRWTYNSGLHVPLIVYFPPKFAHLAPEDYGPGGESSRLVGFIDLAPTVLSLAGMEPPRHFQGNAFAGPHQTPPPSHAFGFRGRMDERYDMVRSVRNHRYIYIRNYMPHRIYGQYIQYMFQTPTTRVWKQRYDDNLLSPEQSAFWRTKPFEELYDLQADPDELNNLAGLPEHRTALHELRLALQRWSVQIRDVGYLPEDEIHRRSQGSTPYEMGHDPYQYPFERVFRTAEAATSPDHKATVRLVRRAFDDPDPAVRYWATMACLIREKDGTRRANRFLLDALEDESPSVRVTAAEALGRFGDATDQERALSVLLNAASLDDNSVYTVMQALNGIDYMDERAAPIRDQIAQLPQTHENVPSRMRGYVPNLIRKILADLDASPDQ